MADGSYIKGLNEAQKEAVLYTEGPLLIIAGAGAGKTKTIVHRIAYLIEHGVPPQAILAVTFTNKAATEMRERVQRLIGERRATPLLCTFHALGARLLREFHGAAGLPPRFSIWDRDESVKALKRILAELGSDLSPKSVLSAISRAKGDGISGHEYAEHANDHWKRSVVRAWDLYDRTLRNEHALDFDDLLLETLSLLRRSSEIRSLLQSRWRYLTIDEYQDTNRSQMEIVRLLAGERKNVCVVGDIDQNIYSWRGADIEHLLSFEQAFPGARTVTLEENYRSTRTILAAANAIIEKNVRRKPKTLFTKKETGEPIYFYGAQNELDEAYFVAEIAARHIKEGEDPRHIAVLYRENFQSRVLEETFLRLSVPYRVLGTRFFERKEVRDVLSYLRASRNPAAKSDLTRIVAVPPRGIGKVTLAKMLSNDEERIPSASRPRVLQLRETLSAIEKAAETAPCSEAVRFAIEASGIEAMLKKDREEGAERLANVRELVNLATKYDHDTPPHGIEKLLEDAALESEQDELGRGETGKGAVSLMTVHASKGLEFGTVFVTGLEQGLFPSERLGDTERDPEEERRLFYVAVTRAMRRLYLSAARERMRYGSREYAIASEFLDDIDPRLMASAGAFSEHEDIIEA